MQILAEVSARSTPAGCVVDVEAATDSGEILADVDGITDAALLSALRPRGGVQRVGVRVYAQRSGNPHARTGGDRIDPYLVGGWRVSRSLGQVAATASFEVGLNNGYSPLGSQIATPAPLPGPGPIDVTLAYRVDDGTELEHPLMQYALAADNERSDVGPITDRLELIDRTPRFRAAAYPLRLPAGHGLTYVQVLRRIALAMMGPSDGLVACSMPDIEGDFAFRKEVRLDRNGDGIALANELGDLWGLALHFDEWGVWTHAQVAPESIRGPILGVIDERDILRSVNGSIEPITIRPMPEAWTSVCLSGTIQRTREIVGRHSVPLPFRSVASFAPRVARYRNGTGAFPGTYTDTGITAAEREDVRSEGTTTLDVDGETVVGIHTTAAGWMNLSSARYSIDASLNLTPLGSVYVEEQTNGALAYAWSSERFVSDFNESRSSREYDASNRLSREVEESYGYLHARAAIQSRALRSSSWEDTVNAPGINGRLVLGNGEGVIDRRASRQLIERRIVTHGSSDDNYRVYRRTEKWGWGKAQGWQYHYGDGTDSSEATETFQALSVVEEFWRPVPGREDLHVYRVQEFGIGGKLVRQDTETRQGALEPADMRTDIAPSRDDYDSDADYALAVAASRVETQPMHAEMVDQDALDHVRTYKEPQRITYEYAQATWQLLNICRRLFIKGRARVVSFTVPPNPLYRMGTWWRARYRRAGADVDHDGVIADVGYERRGGGGPIVQRLAVMVFG